MRALSTITVPMSALLALAAERPSGIPDYAPIPSAFAFAKNIPGKVTKLEMGDLDFRPRRRAQCVLRHGQGRDRR